MAKLKFQTVKKCEYFDVVKNSIAVATYHDEINNLSWRELQNKIGDEHGGGLYHYSFKQVGLAELNRGTIRGIVTKIKSDDPNASQIELLKNQITGLTQSINKEKQNLGGMGIDFLLNVSKQGYETQIKFYEVELARRQSIIDKLEKEIEELEKELDKAYRLVEQSKETSGIEKVLTMIEPFKAMIGKKTSLPVESLASSNTSDIPGEILEILGMVDYSKIPAEQLEKIINTMKMFVHQLPLKGN